ncbi:Uncharacterised protein [Klebsiella pneumoniae]|uniref:Uncharacterized protein n=1 Tax=Klebsiella pneumoniae TaxID=573 RepID=A0A2X3DZJ4_KLEPN|nr:Uncharacterised protein [Klebsiella pneumoniae]
MAKGKAARTECVAQSIGGRNNSATSFWDRILTVEETATLIGVRISELKDAVRYQKLLKGRQLQKYIRYQELGNCFLMGDPLNRS